MIPNDARLACEIMAQEVAHSYGLDHEMKRIGLLERPQVRARGEDLGRAREDDAADLGVAVVALDGCGQRFKEFGGQRVALLGPVDPEGRDVTLGGVPQFIAHGKEYTDYTNCGNVTRRGGPVCGRHTTANGPTPDASIVTRRGGPVCGRHTSANGPTPRCFRA